MAKRSVISAFGPASGSSLAYGSKLESSAWSAAGKLETSSEAWWRAVALSGRPFWPRPVAQVRVDRLELGLVPPLRRSGPRRRGDVGALEPIGEAHRHVARQLHAQRGAAPLGVRREGRAEAARHLR